jgi:hypothetical protein
MPSIFPTSPLKSPTVQLLKAPSNLSLCACTHLLWEFLLEFYYITRNSWPISSCSRLIVLFVFVCSHASILVVTRFAYRFRYKCNFWPADSNIQASMMTRRHCRFCSKLPLLFAFTNSILQMTVERFNYRTIAALMPLHSPPRTSSVVCEV